MGSNRAFGGSVGSPEVWSWQSWHFGAKLGILANLPPMVESWAQYSTPSCCLKLIATQQEKEDLIPTAGIPSVLLSITADRTR